MIKICSIDGCGKPMQARTWCKKHWARWKNNGSPHKVKSRAEYTNYGVENPSFKHGCERHPLYGTWANMMRRCYKTEGIDYPRYGGRGISVSPEWHDVRAFIRDMEPRPNGTTLDRKDNYGNYSKDNCRWASRADQSRNRRTTKLSEEKAKRVIEMRKSGIKRAVIAEEMGVGLTTIKKILGGHIWKPQYDQIVGRS